MKIAPPFALIDQNNTNCTLADFAGHWLVLYFYPKDDTPGCTTEACSFRDQRDYLQTKGLTVVGVSKDSPASHRRFIDKYKLNFTLLSDPDKSTARAFGATGTKQFMGKDYEAVLRNTYLINPNGEIVKEYVNVQPQDHALQILADVEALQ